MGFNYAIEKAKFEREWTQLRVEYTAQTAINITKTVAKAAAA